MQPKLTPFLVELGLSPNQVQLYLYFLEHGEGLASQAASKLHMDKSSAYRAAEELVVQGLLIKNPRPRGTIFSASNPEILSHLLTQKILSFSMLQQDLTKAVSIINAQTKTSSFATSVKIEKGMSAHHALMEESLNSKEKLIREKFPLNRPAFSSPQYKDYVEDFVKRRVKRSVHIRQLYDFSDKPTWYPLMKTSNELLKEVRIVPSEINDNTYFRVFDDTVVVLVYNYQENDFILITLKDHHIALLLKCLFDYIWSRSAVFHSESLLPTVAISTTTRIPSIGIGTWGIEGFALKNPYTDDINDIDQLRHSLGKGQTYIDTSLTYAEGTSLDLIAKVIKNFPRKSLFITSKLSYDITSSSDVEKQCDVYLQRLGLDYVDQLQIHSPRAITIPIGAVAQEVGKLITKGKAKYFGVSNFNIDQLKEAITSSPSGVASHEIHYNLLIRANEENGVVNFCQQNKILLIAFQPLRRGFLSGLEDKTLQELSQKYHKTQSQIAINWLLSKPGVMVLVKSTNGSHINENAASVGWSMTTGDYQRLDNWKLPGYQTPKYDQTGKSESGVKIWKL